MAESIGRCPSTRPYRGPGQGLRCQRAAGHEGNHYNDEDSPWSLSWPKEEAKCNTCRLLETPREALRSADMCACGHAVTLHVQHTDPTSDCKNNHHCVGRNCQCQNYLGLTSRQRQLLTIQAELSEMLRENE